MRPNNRMLGTRIDPSAIVIAVAAAIMLLAIMACCEAIIGFVSVCRIGQRKRHFGALSPRAIFGVSFSGDAVAA